MKGILKKKGAYGGGIQSGGSRGKEFKAKSLIGKTIEVKNRRFKVKEVLGEGGYSNVYRVVEEHTDIAYALKRMLLSADEIDLVKREVSLMKSIAAHRNLIHFECANVTTGTEKRRGEDLMEANIVMEYADVRLFDVMEARHTEGKFFTEVELVTIMTDVCEGVSTLHQHRPPIAHRDIKVENVLLGNDGAYKLCDFGSATSVVHHPKTQSEREAAEADIERNTTMVYRAPEMLDLYAAKPIDEKADIWALGCMLYKVCFFEDAFSTGGRLAILKGSYTFPEVPKYSAEIYDLIRYMLEVDTNVRPGILWVIRRLHKLKASLGLSCDDEVPAKHKRSRTWSGSVEDSIDTKSRNSPHSNSLRANQVPSSQNIMRKMSQQSQSPKKLSDSHAAEGRSTLPREPRSLHQNGVPRRELQFADGPSTASDVGGTDGPHGRSTSAQDTSFAFPPASGSSHMRPSGMPVGSPFLNSDFTSGSPLMMGTAAGSPAMLPGSPLLNFGSQAQSGLTMLPIGSGGILGSHQPSGGLTITPLASGGLLALPHGLGGLSMVPLHSGGNQTVSAGGLSITPLPSGGPQAGRTLNPLVSGGNGGLAAMSYSAQQIASNGGSATGAQLQTGESGTGKLGLSIKPISSGGPPGGNTTPPRMKKKRSSGTSSAATSTGAATTPSGGTMKGSGGRNSRGEVMTFQKMMQLIEKEKEEEHDKKGFSLDSGIDLQEIVNEKNLNKQGSSKKKKKKRRDVIPGASVHSSDEDGMNMLASSEHELPDTKAKRKLKSDKGKEKGFKEILVTGSLEEGAAAKDVMANRKSKLFGKHVVEYAGESILDEESDSFGLGDETVLSPFNVANSSPIPLSVALASTIKESKQVQFINANIPIHESFPQHSFDPEFVFEAEYLAREAVAKGIKIWALKPANTPVDDPQQWLNHNITDGFFNHLKSRNLANNIEDSLRCLLALLKMLQEGSPCVLTESLQHLSWLQNLRNLSKEKLLQLLCLFLEKKIQFHHKYPQFEGTYSLQTYHAQKRLKSDHFARQAASFQELEDLLGIEQALLDIPNLMLPQLDTYDSSALELLPALITESHGIISMATYLLVKLKVFGLDKDKLGTFQELKSSYKSLYSLLSRFYSQSLHCTNIPSTLVPMLPQRQKISVSLNVQALHYPVSYNPHFVHIRLRTLSKEVSVDKDREKKERKEREKREKDEKKREKERSKMEKKREKEMKKGLRSNKKASKDPKKDLKREMQKEWEEELEREREREKGRSPDPLTDPSRRLAASLGSTDGDAVSPIPAEQLDEAKLADVRARLDALLQLPENKTCAECGTSGPRWASTNLGIFICLGCSGIHRGLGTHVSKVKSCTLDVWSPSQIEFMEKMGNRKASEQWEARVPPNYQRPNELSPKEMLKRWIEDKYVYKRFLADNSVTLLSSGTPVPHHYRPTPQIGVTDEHGTPTPTEHRSPLRRTHSRSKSYAGHEKTPNEFDVSRMVSQQNALFDASWNPFS